MAGNVGGDRQLTGIVDLGDSCRASNSSGWLAGQLRPISDIHETGDVAAKLCHASHESSALHLQEDGALEARVAMD